MACIAALGVDHHSRASFCFVHVNLFLILFFFRLPTSWHISGFGSGMYTIVSLEVFNKTTLHKVVLNCSVPSVPNSFLFVVPRHVPTIAEISNFITYNDHMCAGGV
jgi:hypothetical protein